MVEGQLRARGLSDPVVLAAMAEVPRHVFVPERHRALAYADQALPLAHGQTISQPYIVGLMTAALRPAKGLRALEIGTGSGYQTAVLAACGLQVYSIERIAELRRWATENLAAAGYLDRVRLRLGDGSRGWPDEAPFDRILLTAAAERIPTPLREQLATGGLLVGPIGDPYLQTIYRYTKRRDGSLARESLEGARFVPLVPDGEPGDPRAVEPDGSSTTKPDEPSPGKRDGPSSVEPDR